jgi:hypothetical protein
MHIEELPLRVCPAGGFGDAAFIQPGITCITIGLENTPDRCQVRARMISLAVSNSVE